MSFARYDLTATDEQGNIIAGASVEVRAELPGQPLSSLYSDRAGTTPIANPTTTDSHGDAGFYITGGFYKITVTSGLLTKTRRHVGIGMAQGSDVQPEGITQRYHTDPGTVTVDVDDTDIIVIKKTVGEPTPVELPDPADATRKVRIVDGKYDAATNNITITSLGTAKTIMGVSSYVIDSNGASIELTPLDDGSGWI
jgi:hypothetical protein